MSSISEEISVPLAGHLSAQLNGLPAANSDHLRSHLAGHDEVAPAALGDTATGWDSYDVWRRFIKDARNRRRADPA